MKQYLLDTHALVWYLTAPDKLGRAAKRAVADIEAGRAQGWLSAVSLMEVTLLRERGRTKLHTSAVEDALLDVPSMHFLAVDWAQTKEFDALVVLPDVFDRMIVAAARHLGAGLLTCDGVITDSGLARIVWD